jgi:hypothetical protein
MPGFGYTFNYTELQRIKDYINTWLAEHNNSLDGVSWRDLVYASGKSNVGNGSLRLFGIADVDGFDDFMTVLGLREYLETDRENAFRGIYEAAANPQPENSSMQPGQGGRRRNRRGRKTSKKSKRRTAKKSKRRHTRRHHR